MFLASTTEEHGLEAGQFSDMTTGLPEQESHDQHLRRDGDRYSPLSRLVLCRILTISRTSTPGGLAPCAGSNALDAVTSSPAGAVAYPAHQNAMSDNNVGDRPTLYALENAPGGLSKSSVVANGPPRHIGLSGDGRIRDEGQVEEGQTEEDYRFENASIIDGINDLGRRSDGQTTVDC